jgi:hypothetical protein
VDAFGGFRLDLGRNGACMLLSEEIELCKRIRKSGRPRRIFGVARGVASNPKAKIQAEERPEKIDLAGPI